MAIGSNTANSKILSAIEPREDKKKVILFILTQAFNPIQGGVQRTTKKLGNKFSELGYVVKYYSFSKQGHIPMPPNSLFHSLKEGKNKNEENLAHFKHILLSLQPSVVINQMPYEKEIRDTLTDSRMEAQFMLIGCLRNSLFALKNNLGHTISTHFPFPINKLFNNAIGRYLLLQYHHRTHRNKLKQILDVHDKYVLLTPPNKMELKYFVGDYKMEKVTIIPNSIPKSQKALPKKEKILLHVGRVVISQKRADLLLDVWEQCQSQLPDWKFILVGDGPYFVEMESEIQNRGLDRIILKGYKEPNEYYARASIFFKTSAFEGFPNTILEAISFGCIPVAFNSYPAIGHILKDKVDSILIKPYDTKKMAREITKLATDPIRLRQMQEHALETSRKYEIDKVIEYWIHLFKEFGN